MASDKVNKPVKANRKPLTKATPKIKKPVQLSLSIIPMFDCEDYGRTALNHYSSEQGAELGMNILDFTCKGIQEWSSIVNECIIRTTNSHNDLTIYSQINMRQSFGVAPNVSIVPGLKTSLIGFLPDPFDSLYNQYLWNNYALSASSICGVSNSTEICFNQHKILQPYFSGKKTINYDQIKLAFAPLLASGLTPLWDYPFVSNSPSAEETTKFVESVKSAIPQSAYMTHYRINPDWDQDISGNVTYKHKMIGIVGIQNIYEKLQVTIDGVWRESGMPDKTVFTPAQAVEEILKSTNKFQPKFIIETGADWILVAQAFKEELKAKEVL